MRRINFFTTESGNKPVQEFLDSLSDKQAEKILWVLRFVREYENVPRQYFKKLMNTDGLCGEKSSRIENKSKKNTEIRTT